MFPVLLAGALLAAATIYLAGRGRESTDDAQVEGHIISISARVSGHVAKVLARDNQLVKEGDVLVELDGADLATRLQTAQAELTSAEAQLVAAQAQLGLTRREASAGLRQAQGGLRQASAGFGSSRAGIQQAQADLGAASVHEALAARELQRVRQLHEEQAVTQSELDSRRALFEQAQAQTAVARARLRAASMSATGWLGSIESAKGRLQSAESGPEQIVAAQAAVSVAKARVQQATAAKQLAALNLSYTTIRAPAAGVVSRRIVEIGQTVSPDRPLLAVIPLDDIWVVANFKESQLADMHPGQPVHVRIDAFPGRDLQGHVDSIAGASGARFALLPPDNASGNFTKVVQRVPVLIRLDGAPGATLLPGMNAVVTVLTAAVRP